MSSPCVSICIPTYKGAGTIGAAIESVLAQTFSDLELIVVDDGSPDDTAAVVAAFADPRLAYHRNERNLGPKGNWNRCLELARGTYFKLLPHDDLLHPQCLQRQVAVLDADLEHAVALVCCARDIIGPEGRVLLRRRGWPGATAGPKPLEAVLKACLLQGTNVIGEPGAVLCRTALAMRIGGFDDRHPYVIDLEYWIRLLQHGELHYLDEALASFRVWKGSWSVAIGGKQSRQFKALMDDVCRHTPLSLSPAERLRAAAMPGLNRWARQVFYVTHLR